MNEFNQNRFEKKYLVPSSRLIEISDALSGCLVPDSHNIDLNNGYYTQSIYFDSTDLICYREKTEGLDRRLKCRLRTYKDSLDQLPKKYFLELKKRIGHVNKKDRTSLDLEVARALIEGSTLTSYDLWSNRLDSNSTLRYFYFLSHRYNFQPKVVVLYHRTAFISTIYRGLRVTFDTRLRASSVTKLSPPLSSFWYVLDPRYSIVELKYSGKLPALISNRFLELGMTQVTYSKYASSVEAISRVRSGAENGLML